MIRGYRKTSLQKHLAVCEALSLSHGLKIIGRNFGFSQNASSATTDIGGTSRFSFKPVGSISRLACLLTSGGTGAGSVGNTEADGTATVNQIYYEYGGSTMPDSKSGKNTIICDSAMSFVQSDGVGVNIPAQSSFFVRMYHSFAFLPSSTPTATAIAGGSLAAQAWYYVVTRVMNGLESSPSAEFTATTASSNLTIAITIADTKSASADYYNIYRSSAMGGTKQFLGTTNGRTKRFVDDGSLSVDTTINPPASGKKYFLNRVLTKIGDCSTHTAAGQDGRNVASSNGIFSAYGPSFIFGSTPLAVVGDDRSGKSILVFGDSIFAGKGFGIQSGFYPQEKGCWDAAFNDGEINSLNFSFGGATLSEIINPTTSGGGRSRLKCIPYADYLIDELAINDLGAGRTWQQLAADKLTLAAICAKFGVKYILTTVLPKVTQTTACITIAGQTPMAGNERKNFNLWVRARCPVDSNGVADMSGTPSSLVSDYIELCTTIEANESNVLTPNGGYFKVPNEPISTGLVFNGTPTSTNLPTTTSLVTNENLGRVIKITSGVRSGQYCVVKSNTTSAFTVYASGDLSLAGVAVPSLAGAPSAGDTFDLYESIAPDGLHPSLAGHTQLASVIREWLLDNVI